MHKNLRSLATIAGALALAASTLTGCSTSDSPTDGADKGTIGIIAYGTNTYNNCWTTGALEALEGTGYKGVILNSKADPNQEIANFETLIGKGVKGIVTNSTSPQSSERGALLADRAGILTTNSAWNPPGSENEKYVGRVTLDDAAGAKLTSEWVGANVKPTEVLLINGVPGDPTGDAWTADITKRIEALPGGFTVVGVQPGMYQRTNAQTAAENLFTAHPDAKLVITYAAEMAIGVSEYLQRAGKTDVTLIGSDWSPEMVDLMKEGKITAARYYSPAEIARLATESLLAGIADGGAEQKTINLPNQVVTGAEIDAATKDIPPCYDQFLDQAKASS